MALGGTALESVLLPPWGSRSHTEVEDLTSGTPTAEPSCQPQPAVSWCEIKSCSVFLNSFTDPLDVIDVDWSGLMPKHPKEPREPGAALLKFTPGAVLLRVGISKKLAGSELFTKVKETCQRLLEKPKGNFILL